ncbi:MAG TPA: DUF2185 domain-containing protein [Sphingomonas sp.]|nr:DUF2185 domain-containing protein [Sphingomonas sp.]
MSGITLPPGVEVRDPRLVAAQHPYTFWLPHPVSLAALEAGDIARFIFFQTDRATQYNGERMWVLVQQIDDGHILGTLDNEPVDMPRIQRGAEVCVPISHAIDFEFAPGKQGPVPPHQREYWDLCFVDSCILEQRSRVNHLYREAPMPRREGDTDPDSGWRIRGTAEAIAEDERRGQPPQFVALGAVLNCDDSWLDLIDAPVGAAYAREGETGDFVPYDPEPESDS